MIQIPAGLLWAGAIAGAPLLLDDYMGLVDDWGGTDWTGDKRMARQRVAAGASSGLADSMQLEREILKEETFGDLIDRLEDNPFEMTNPTSSRLSMEDQVTMERIVQTHREKLREASQPTVPSFEELAAMSGMKL